MLKKILKLNGATELSKNEQKEISGGAFVPVKRCGGDGSFIFVGGQKVCCYIPAQNNYIC